MRNNHFTKGRRVMYLARQRKGNVTHYAIRESYLDGQYWKSRHLCDLGTDPSRHIHYPGGNGYYYAPEILEALSDKGLDIDQSSLDMIFFEFISPHIRRVIKGFDRSRRKAHPQEAPAGSSQVTFHLFDKRRFYFLRFGPRHRQNIHRVPDKIFRPLQCKSRDELEQYFLCSESALRPQEKSIYVATIFELNHFVPDRSAGEATALQLDGYFLDRLCRLAIDHKFWQGGPASEGLGEYLVRYAVMYFDYEYPPRPAAAAFVQDFIRRHRVYRPPKSVRTNIHAAEKLFELSWEELKRLPRRSLSRRYRRLSLKHHPDHGGDPAQFNRLTQIYRHLLSKN
jgi:hypothetical protein